MFILTQLLRLVKVGGGYLVFFGRPEASVMFDVVMSWLRLKPLMEYILRPYDMYIKCFGTLIYMLRIDILVPPVTYR